MVQLAQLAVPLRGRDETRARILAAARELFARDGVEPTSVRAIASHAELTDPAVYYYYPSKVHMLRAVLSDVPPHPVWSGGEGEGTRDKVVDHVFEVFWSWVNQPEIFKLILREGLEQNETTIAFGRRLQASFKESVLPALRSIYGQGAPDVLRTVTVILRGFMFDAILTHGDQFRAVAAEDTFRCRIRTLISTALPTTGAEPCQQ